MPTHTEVLPAIRSSPHNGLDYTPGTRELVVKTSRAYVTYSVAEFPVGWRGRGFRLTKDGGESYAVFCSADGQAADSCDCAGATHTGRCTHKAAVRSLVENGWL